MPALKVHRRTLGRAQQAVLKRLAPVAREHGFYLAGGTGLALQLGHRRSIDFDWFCDQPIDDPLRLAAEIQAAGVGLTPTRAEKGTLHGLVAGVRVSFLEYRYPLLRPLLTDSGLPLASLEDIAAMKLAAIAQRGARKDFVDVFALGRRFSLDEMLGLYRKKYGVRDTGHVLVALSYFDDADRQRMPTLLVRWAWPAIKAAIRAWVLEAAKE